ncbi:hypothetical protein [Pseudomonas sp. AK106]
MDNPNPQDLQQYILILKQLKELTPIPNPWIPVLSAIAGGLIASVPTSVGALIKRRSTRLAVEKAILAEVANAAAMIRRRGYLEQLEKTRIELLEINNQIASTDRHHDNPNSNATATFEVAVSDDYNKIYKANLQHIGIIDKTKCLQIVSFYNLIESLILDLKASGTLGSVGAVEDYSEAISFLKEALAIADRLTAQPLNFYQKFSRRNAL